MRQYFSSKIYKQYIFIHDDVLKICKASSTTLEYRTVDNFILSFNLAPLTIEHILWDAITYHPDYYSALRKFLLEEIQKIS